MTGIEPSRIRFIELEFKEFFEHWGERLQSTGFESREVDLLREIHDRIFLRGELPADVRRELRNRRKGCKTIAVTSGKGGVGKTTVSINLAIAMAHRGLRTLLLDADMGLGNVHVFAGIAPRGTVMDLVDGKATAEQILSTGPGNIQVLCGASGSARLADIGPRGTERLIRELELLGKSFDVILIDTGAGISPQVTQFLAMADDIVVVTTPNIASTLDAYGVIKIAREAGMRGSIHLLVNQVDDEKQSRSVYEKLSQCALRFLRNRPANLGWLTRDTAFEESNQTRRPLLLSHPDNPNARRLKEMAEALCVPAGTPAAEPPVAEPPLTQPAAPASARSGSAEPVLPESRGAVAA